MAVNSEYRSTELGTFPNDWRVDELDALDPFVTSGSRGWARYYKDTGASFVRITNLSRGSIDLDLSDLKFVVVSHNDREGIRTALEAGDLLVSITADIGIIGYVDAHLPKPAYINQHIALVRCDSGAANTKFLAYFLASEQPQRAFRGATDQGAKAGMNLGGIRRILAAFPPRPEQDAIAEALSDVDALLAGLDRLIAKKRDLKQAAMQQLLTGQTRLPGFQGGWQAKRLSSAGKCLRGVNYSGDADLSAHDTATTKRLLRSNNVQAATVVTTDVQYVNAARVSPQQILARGDILICTANGSKALVGKAGRFAQNDGYEYTFGAFMGCFRTSASDADSTFVFYLFQTGRYRDFVNDLLAGSSINNLKPSSIDSLEFAFPPLLEQTAIATVLSDMDAELTALEARRDKTRALKQAMMQELLTGKTRLV